MYKLIVNLKTYKESTGEEAVKIAKIVKSLEKKAKEKNVDIILCPQAVDIKEILKTGIKVYAQHVDDFSYGSNTGHIIPEVLSEMGVTGTLISHSEYILNLKEIEKRVKVARKAGLETCVCARTSFVASKISQLRPKPDYIAVEPKELIGGDISISTAKPQLIMSSKKAIGNVKLLVGAGVKNTDDVKKSVSLGAKGVLVASGVVKAKDIKKSIEELLAGF